MKIFAALLTDAKNRLAKDGSEVVKSCMQMFICHTIKEGTWSRDGWVAEKNQTEIRKLKNLILERLNGCYSIEEWLEVNGHLVTMTGNESDAEYIAYYDVVQAYRHRWIESLIKEFS